MGEGVQRLGRALLPLRVPDVHLRVSAVRGRFRVAFPRPEFCTDNGAMIAFAGALRLAAGLHDDAAIRVFPRWDLEAQPALA